MNNHFSADEFMRYPRHFALPHVGNAGQHQLRACLKQSRVLCVGAGGLGAPVLMYLTAAGIGTIGLVDFDCVELSNLQRQLLFNTDDINQPKVLVAQQKLNQLNPHVKVVAFNEKFSEMNAASIVKNFDVVVDCSDNFPTRYLINDTCVQLKKPNVYASIFQFLGQCAVFAAPNGPCYRCLYETPPPNVIPNCAQSGVLGVLPGILGSIQAAEVIKLLLQIGQPLIGNVLTLNALTMEFKRLRLGRREGCLCAGH